MADEPTETTPTEDVERDAQTSSAQDGQRDAATSTTPPATDDNDPVKLRALVDKLRPHERESARLKRELDAANAKLKAAEDAEKSDLDKATEERDALKAEKADFQTRIRKQAVAHAAEIAARDAGFADPADVTRFLDLDAIEFDDQDRPQGVADAVKKLAADKPYLVKAATNGGPPATPRSDRPNGTMTADEKATVDRGFAHHTRSRF